MNFCKCSVVLNCIGGGYINVDRTYTCGRLHPTAEAPVSVWTMIIFLVDDFVAHIIVPPLNIYRRALVVDVWPLIQFERASCVAPTSLPRSTVPQRQACHRHLQALIPSNLNRILQKNERWPQNQNFETGVVKLRIGLFGFTINKAEISTTTGVCLPEKP